MKIQIYCRTISVELYSFVATFTVYSLTFRKEKKQFYSTPRVFTVIYSFLNSLQVRKRCAQYSSST